MVWIPGSNNGEWGLNMSRGAVFPTNMGGPFGFRGYPLPQLIQHPTSVVDRPYQGNAFGRRYGRRFGKVYELTPGGVTTEVGWEFNNKIRSFGLKNKRKSRKKSKKSKKSRKKSKKSRF